MLNLLLFNDRMKLNFSTIVNTNDYVICINACQESFFYIKEFCRLYNKSTCLKTYFIKQLVNAINLSNFKNCFSNVKLI